MDRSETDSAESAICRKSDTAAARCAIKVIIIHFFFLCRKIKHIYCSQRQFISQFFFFFLYVTTTFPAGYSCPRLRRQCTCPLKLAITPTSILPFTTRPTSESCSVAKTMPLCQIGKEKTTTTIIAAVKGVWTFRTVGLYNFFFCFSKLYNFLVWWYWQVSKIIKQTLLFLKIFVRSCWVNRERV